MDGWRFGLLPFVARLLLGAEFAIAVNGKVSGWDGQAAYMAAHGLHWITPLLAMALIIELVGTLCLVTGFVTRTAAAIMFVYLGIVSISLHDFWHMSGNSAGMNQTQFFKNLGMMGGLLLLSVYGPGRWALSAALARRQRRATGSAGGIVSERVALFVTILFASVAARPIRAQTAADSTGMRSSASLTGDPYVGKWKVNPSKSRLNDEMTIQAAGVNRYIITFEPGAVDTVVSDGSFQRALGGTTLSMTVKGPDRWRVVRKMENRTLLSAEWSLSEDGGTLTDDYTQYENDAPKFTVHYVYQRSAGTSGLAGTWDSENAQMDAGMELQITPYGAQGLSFVIAALNLNQNVTFDGRASPVAGSGGSISGRRVSERSLEITARVRGEVRQIEDFELSPDGRSLTMTVLHPGQSKPAAIFVFDRQ